MVEHDGQRRPIALISLDGRDASLANRRMDYAEEKNKLVVNSSGILAHLSGTNGTLDSSVREYNKHGQDSCDNGVWVCSIRRMLSHHTNGFTHDHSAVSTFRRRRTRRHEVPGGSRL
jgi:hypothetical protein